MALSATPTAPLILYPSSSSSSPPPISISYSTPLSSHRNIAKNTHFNTSVTSRKRNHSFICRAAEYKFPDPIPEFADAETEKFRTQLIKKLSKKDMFGESVEEVVGICTEIFNDFLHTEYGGPGTLLVIPFIDMADTLNERGLPGVLKLHEQLLNGLKITSTRTGKSGLESRVGIKCPRYHIASPAGAL